MASFIGSLSGAVGYGRLGYMQVTGPLPRNPGRTSVRAFPVRSGSIHEEINIMYTRSIEMARCNLAVPPYLPGIT